VLLPPPGRTELGIDSSFTWEGAQELAEEDRPVGAYYTLREWRADTHELDMLFVLHGDTGPASAWAARAQPGDAVALWGPREGWDPPPGAEWYLLVADDTGLPAVACILETLPDGARVQVIAEVDDETEHQELPVRPGVDVRWCHRYGAEPGTTTLLLDAVRALTFPPGTGYVWGGAESRAMTQVRKLARQERGLPRASVLLVGYWRHVAHGDDIDTDD